MIGEAEEEADVALLKTGLGVGVTMVGSGAKEDESMIINILWLCNILVVITT